MKEFKKFIKCVDNNVYKQFFYLMYFTGTRPGEAMALKFSDLYFNEISINKEISEHCINGSGVIDSTKSISSYRTVFIDKKAEPIPVWIITKPDMVEKMQSRSYHRVRKSLPVRVTLIDTDGTREEPFDTHTVDLSGGGVRIVVPRRVAVGSHAALEFNNFADIGTLRVMCRIARCVDVGHDEHIYHAGAVFKDLPRLILNRLVKYIFSIEREELAKGLETR